MPVVRSLRTKERKLKEQSALVDRILLTGFEMFPCSNCERNSRHCVASSEEGSARCSECARRGIKCDVEGIPIGDWDALNREEIHLKNERDAAFRSAMESLARMERLEKQQEFLKRKGKDMLRRGLKTMDELDEAEEKERQEKENSERTIPTDPADPFALDPALVLDQSFWVELGFVNGIPPASQGN
jgi:hypothetical protein